MVDFGLRTGVGKAENEEEEEQNKAETNEAAAFYWDLLCEFFYCSTDWAGEALRAARLVTRHAVSCEPSSVGSEELTVFRDQLKLE